MTRKGMGQQMLLGSTITFLLALVTLAMGFPRESRPQISVFRNTSRESSPLPIGIGIISTPPTKRLSSLFKLWGYAFQNISYQNSIFLASEFCSNFSGYPCHPIPKKYMDYLDTKRGKKMYADFNRAVKRVFLLSELLKMPEIQWMLVITDDVVINLDKLPNVLQSLAKLGDPANASIIKCHCLDAAGGFPQGGVGTITSRKASQLLVDKADDWLKIIRRNDDVEMHKWFKMIDVETKQIDSGFLLGHALPIDQFKYVQRENWSMISECPNNYTLTYCSSKFYSLDDIAIWHSHIQKISEDEMVSTNKSIPKFVKFYTSTEGGVHICRKV